MLTPIPMLFYSQIKEENVEMKHDVQRKNKRHGQASSSIQVGRQKATERKNVEEKRVEDSEGEC